MKIIQITDMHIGRKGENTFNTDVRGNFLRVLEMARSLHPDHLVLSGDFCFDQPEREVYQWVRQQLDPTGIPYDLISGNHDDPGMLAAAFERTDLLRNGELFFTKAWGDTRILFLDTTTGKVSQAQLGWLKEQFASSTGPLLLFMHHPPFLSGVPHMDRKYALVNREEVQRILFDYEDTLHIFTGHYHVDKTVQKQNVIVYITPACFFQIDQHEEEFKVDHRIPGLREITLEDGKVMTTVKYARP